MFYEHSDKCGKLLVHALKGQQARTFVPELLDESRTKAHTTEEIAEIFRKYYTALYNPMSEMENSSKRGAIQEYIQKSGLPRLSEEDLAALEEPLMAEEATLATAQMKLGPWPRRVFPYTTGPLEISCLHIFLPPIMLRRKGLFPRRIHFGHISLCCLRRKRIHYFVKTISRSPF